MGNKSTKIETKNKKHICEEKQTQTRGQKNNDEATLDEEEIKNIIRKYEHVKNNKRIANVDVIVGVMKNTDWDKVEMVSNIPSAPLLPVVDPVKTQMPITTHIPIAVAQIIVDEHVQIAKAV
jgi:hypothetical protein